MARPGVTFEDVAKAAAEVRGQGKNITIENVRAILGTGSIGTINNHLRQWKEAQYAHSKMISQENLPEELVKLLGDLWKRLLYQSEKRVTMIEISYQQEISQLQQQLNKYKNNNRRWQQLFTQWQQEKKTLLAEKLNLEKALKENQSLSGSFIAHAKRSKQVENDIF